MFNVYIFRKRIIHGFALSLGIIIYAEKKNSSKKEKYIHGGKIKEMNKSTHSFGILAFVALLH
jgi:hypothetical protein